MYAPRKIPEKPTIIGLAAAYLVTFWIFVGFGVVGYSLLLLLPPLIWLSVLDLDRRVIPDLATLAIASIGAARLATEPLEVLALTILAAVALFMFLAVLGQIYWSRHQVEALGLGDAKLIAAGVLVVGLGGVWAMLLLASVGGIAAALVRPSSESPGVPFGPFLAYSIFVTPLIMGSPA